MERMEESSGRDMERFWNRNAIDWRGIEEGDGNRKFVNLCYTRVII